MLKAILAMAILLIISNVLWYLLYKNCKRFIQKQEEDLADMSASLIAAETEAELAKDQLKRMEETREKADAIKSTGDALNELSKPSRKRKSNNS